MSNPSEPHVLPSLPLVDQPVAEPLPAQSLADLGNAVAARRDDPYYGLLTSPPGEWGIIAYGSAQMLIIKGSSEFRERSLNLLTSYIGGVKQRRGWMPDDTGSTGLSITEDVNHVMVPLSKGRLIKALTLWFYGRIYPKRCELVAVYGELTEDDLEAEEQIPVEWTLLNEEAMTTEAATLAESLYASIEGTSLGCRFDSHAPTREEGDAAGYSLSLRG